MKGVDSEKFDVSWYIPSWNLQFTFRDQLELQPKLTEYFQLSQARCTKVYVVTGLT